MKAVERVRRALRARVRRLRVALLSRLERRPSRAWLFAPLLSIDVTLRTRTPCWVSWDDGWVHRYRGGTVVWPTIGAPTPRQLHDRALEVNLFGMQLSEGDTVFDVGSGVGQEVLPFARIVGSSGTLVAIEAHPGTFRLLQQNIVRNHFDNVIAVNSAITDERKAVRIDGEVGGLGNRLTEVGGFSVPGTTIDDVMRNLGIQRVDFLKMNIEGAERDAVVGMEHTIDRTANVCIACHDFLVEETSDSTFATKALVADFLRSHGFVVTMRPDDSRVWVRDRVYGRRAAELPGCTT